MGNAAMEGRAVRISLVNDSRQRINHNPTRRVMPPWAQRFSIVCHTTPPAQQKNSHVMDDDHTHRSTTECTCPHVNKNDLRCGSRFSLSRMKQAFDTCFSAYHTCPMYHRIEAERRQQERDAVRRRHLIAADVRIETAPAASSLLHTVPLTSNGHRITLPATGS